jgi:hypothetical protein
MLPGIQSVDVKSRFPPGTIMYDQLLTESHDKLNQLGNSPIVDKTFGMDVNHINIQVRRIT